MKKILWLITFITVFFACKKQEPEPYYPAPVQLLFPFENSQCNVATDSTEVLGTVHFEWTESIYAHQYELHIKNLLNDETQMHLTEKEDFKLILDRATPYAWHVVSVSFLVDSTASSNVWMFYNAGEAILHHVPFPAEIISPQLAEKLTITNGKILLQWQGLDLDDDIVNYDLFFGTNSPPPLHKANLTETQLEASVNNNTVYYWNVTTTDTQGNKSDTGVYHFKVE